MKLREDNRRYITNFLKEYSQTKPPLDALTAYFECRFGLLRLYAASVFDWTGGYLEDGSQCVIFKVNVVTRDEGKQYVDNLIQQAKQKQSSQS